MRPTQFYALPTLRSEPWHQVYGTLATLFDDDSMEFDMDRNGAEEARAAALVFETKLFDSGDGERTISYEAAVFEGKPFAIVVRSGRGGQDNQSRHITDLDTFQAAKSYVESWRPRATGVSADLVSPDEDLAILFGTYGHAVMEHNGVTRLVDGDHLDENGRMVFDDRAFSAAFDRLVRPKFPTSDNEFAEGIRGQRMRDATVPAILAAVPEGVRATDDFEPIMEVEGYTPINRWSPVLAATDEGTYAIGLLSSGGYFAWASEIRAEKVGPPELYDQLARGSAPKP